MTAPLAYTLEEAAEASRMSLSTLRRAIKATDPNAFPPPLKARLASRKYLIEADELRAWLASLPAA